MFSLPKHKAGYLYMFRNELKYVMSILRQAQDDTLFYHFALYVMLSLSKHKAGYLYMFRKELKYVMSILRQAQDDTLFYHFALYVMLSLSKYTVKPFETLDCSLRARAAFPIRC